MCIRDSVTVRFSILPVNLWHDWSSDEKRRKGISGGAGISICLLYTSDAADERSSVDLGGRRIIKKKNIQEMCRTATIYTHNRRANTKRAEKNKEGD